MVVHFLFPKFKSHIESSMVAIVARLSFTNLAGCQAGFMISIMLILIGDRFGVWSGSFVRVITYNSLILIFLVDTTCVFAKFVLPQLDASAHSHSGVITLL